MGAYKEGGSIAESEEAGEDSMITMAETEVAAREHGQLVPLGQGPPERTQPCLLTP